jgi:transcriptional regulator of acetoin/glycerol metabolism
MGTPARRLSPDALALLEAHAWPDNLRELRHAIEHGAVRCEGPVLEAHHLPDTLRAHVDAARAGTYRAARERGADLAGRTYLIALLERLHGNVTRAAAEAGMERESLHRALRSHGIDPARYRARETPPSESP